MKALKTLFVIAIFVFSSASHAADVFVSHYETLHGMTAYAADSDSANGSTELRGDAPGVLRFEALGRSFDLNLVPNDRLLGAMPERAASAGIYAYRGELAGNPDSWVRIVMFNAMPSGLIFDGKTMYAIESPGDSALEISSPVIYRLSDLNIVPGTMSCSVTAAESNAAQFLDNVEREVGAAGTEALGAVEEITMGVLTDADFTNDNGGDAGALAAVTTRFSNIDGWYSEQVGIQINVQSVDTFDNDSDPFSGTLDTRTLLDELSTYREQTPALNSLGLTHLYTGRDFDGTTVGIAWRGAICDTTYSTGLSEGNRGPTTDALIAAHEIGHNFNAEHDGEAGTPCASEDPTYIMGASVSGREEFSACSIAIMQDEAAHPMSTCVTPLPAVDVSIQQNAPVSNVLLGARTNLDYDVSVNGTVGVNDVSADITLPSTLTIETVTTSTGSCATGAGNSVSCDLGNLGQLSDHSITIATTPSAVGSGMLDASVTTTDTDERASNNQESLQLTVDPAVDLVVDATVPTRVDVDTSTTVTATIDNDSILQATNLDLTVTLDAGLQANTASWSIGTCTVTAQQVDCQASSLGAGSSSSLSISATAVATGTQRVSFSLTSAQAEANPSDNAVTGSVSVRSPQSGGDSGGGGTTNPLFLLLIALASLLGRRQIRR